MWSGKMLPLTQVFFGGDTKILTLGHIRSAMRPILLNIRLCKGYIEENVQLRKQSSKFWNHINI